MPSYSYPPPPASEPPTPIDELDKIVAKVGGNKAKWVDVTYAKRIEILEQIRKGTTAISEGLVADAMASKGLDADHPCFGEDWQTSQFVCLSNITALIDTYASLRDTGDVPLNFKMENRTTGQLAVRTFPGGILDRLLLTFYEGWVIMKQGVTEANLAETAAVHLKTPDKNGKLAFVLGAGNQASIPFQDSLYKLFVENEVVVLKMNPVNEYVGKHIRSAFKPLVDAGFFEVVYGGIEQGAHLCNHPDVDTLHITGSDQTHDAIVWGPRDGRDERKAKGERANSKPISSELGNVTPIIVAPGQWSDNDISYQAANIASMVTNNASFNCIAGKLVVLPAGWDQKDQFVAALRKFFEDMPVRKAYYPGARQRWQSFVEAHPEAERFGESDNPEIVPWTMISGLDPEQKDDICFRTEPFCAVLSIVEVPGKTAVDFLPVAVDFCNDVVWGTLSSSIIIHDKTRKDPIAEAALQEAIDELRYGGVAVNHWAGLPYGIATLTWGAFPGHTLEDVTSGRGIVHNALMFDKPEKSVFLGPFNPPIKPPWNVDNQRYGQIGKALAGYAESPGIFAVLPVAWNAIRG